MSIAEMKNYVKLCQVGASTIPERQKMLDTKLIDLHQKMQDLQNSINFIHYKQQLYRDILSGKRAYFSNLH